MDVFMSSNINGVKGADNLALVNTQQALQGDHGALIGFVPAGKIPREFGLEPGGKTLLVSNNGSGSWWHSGSLPGSTTLMLRTPDAACSAVLCNTRTEPHQEMDSSLFQMVWDIQPLVGR